MMKYLVTHKALNMRTKRALIKVYDNNRILFHGYAESVSIYEGFKKGRNDILVSMHNESACNILSEAVCAEGSFIAFRYEDRNEWYEVYDPAIANGPYGNYVKLSGILK